MNPVIEAAQRKTTLAVLRAQLAAGHITPAQHDERAKEAEKGK